MLNGYSVMAASIREGLKQLFSHSQLTIPASQPNQIQLELESVLESGCGASICNCDAKISLSDASRQF